MVKNSSTGSELKNGDIIFELANFRLVCRAQKVRSTRSDPATEGSLPARTIALQAIGRLNLSNILEALLLLHTLLAPEIRKCLLAREELVDVFELKTLCLREEQVDNGNPGRVEDGKDDVCAPANVVDGRRCDLDDDLSTH
jgi:hypothetical protein